jgi:hypothetical protein
MSDDTLIVTPARQITQQRNAIAWEPVQGGRGLLTNASAILYTAPTKTTPVGTVVTARLTSIIFSNTDASARTVTLYFVESGGSIGASRTILPATSIPAGSTWVFVPGAEGYGVPLDDSETIRGLASVTNVVSYRISVEHRN